jgi:hypothetical protein
MPKYYSIQEESKEEDVDDDDDSQDDSDFMDVDEIPC